MVGALLSKEDCAKCRFCCSFRRQSLWETPAFVNESLSELKKIYPEVRFKTLPDNIVTLNFDGAYQTDDSEEEAPCYFNKSGCILPEWLKPFDCKLWSLRIMRKDGKLYAAISLSCPAIKENTDEEIRTTAEGLSETMRNYAELHPEIIKEYRENYKVLFKLIKDTPSK